MAEVRGRVVVEVARVPSVAGGGGGGSIEHSPSVAPTLLTIKSTCHFYRYHHLIKENLIHTHTHRRRHTYIKFSGHSLGALCRPISSLLNYVLMGNTYRCLLIWRRKPPDLTCKNDNRALPSVRNTCIM